MKYKFKLLFAICIGFFILLCVILFQSFTKHKRDKISDKKTLEVVTAQPAFTSTNTPEPTENTSDLIYSFSQGPKAWKARYTWSGSWSKAELDGNIFGNFGCGFCCMANIYSTLSEYKCSPVDIYSYAKEIAPYHPSPGIGAIDWDAMQITLTSCGFTCTLKNKTVNYDDFVNDVTNAKSTLILVSSSYSDKFWKNTGGHYVTIWNYNPKNDTVFVADPGDPARNRQTIKLSIAYDALKASSLYQYMTIDDYNSNQNQWSWDTISEKWVAP